jgi:hypothetical protein
VAFAGAGARVLAGALVLARARAAFSGAGVYGAGFSGPAGVACSGAVFSGLA